MKKTILLSLCIAVGITGCSSQSRWDKVDGSNYQVNELKSAMSTCDYKNKMRAANMLTMDQSNSPTPQAMSGFDSQRQMPKTESTTFAGYKPEFSDPKSSSKTTLKAQSKKSKSVKSTYQCMEQQGFVRS